MRRIVQVGGEGKRQEGRQARQKEMLQEEIDARVALIQELIPLGLQHVADLLQKEVEALAGKKYSRQGGVPGHVRWGSRGGSVYLLDQKLPVEVTRVRDQGRNKEVPLQAYQALQKPRRADTGVLLRILRGLSCRAYQECV